MRLRSTNFFLFFLPLLAAGGTYFEVVSLSGQALYAFRVAIIFSVVLSLIGVPNRPTLHSASLPYLALMYFWMVWALASTFWAEDIAAASRGFFSLVIGGLTLLALFLRVERSDDLWALRNGWLFASFVMGSFGIYELITGQHLQSEWLEQQPTYAVRYLVIATFGNPNAFGAFLVLAITLILATENASRKGRSIETVLLVFFVFVLILTGNRIGLLGIFAIMAVLSRRNRTVLFFLGIAVIFLLFLPVIADFFDQPTLKSLLALSEHNRISCSSVDIRKNLMIVGLQISASSYFFGVGAKNFPTVVENSAYLSETCGIIDPHNWPIELLSEFGIFVFIAYLFVIMQSVAREHRFRKNGVDIRLNTIILCFGFLFASVSNSSFLGVPMNWLFFGIIALSATPLVKKSRN